MNKSLLLGLVSLLLPNPAYAEERAGSGEGPLVKLTRSKAHIDIKDEKGKVVRIQHNQDTKNKISESFSKTSHKCPQFVFSR